MKKRKLGWLIFLVLQVLFIQLLGFFPQVVEQIYSKSFYAVIAQFSRTILGWIPFSVGDLIYLLVGFLLLKWLVNLFRKPTNWKKISLEIGFGLSIFYFLFHLLWGFNYYRVPLFDKMNIEKDYSDADLLRFTEQMIEKTNAVQVAITQNPRQKVISNLSQETIFEQSNLGYTILAKQHDEFNFEHQSIKKSLISLPLSYMGFSGYLNPFTNEAQVNDRIPLIYFPFTTCHEMAHQIGYASESEANFIGFLAVTKHENLYFKYAGYSTALRYCIRNWQIRNPRKCEELIKKIHPGVLENFKDQELHWLQYETFIEDGFEVFYDRFLKANQQKDGLEGYSKFLNLVINYAENHAV